MTGLYTARGQTRNLHALKDHLETMRGECLSKHAMAVSFCRMGSMNADISLYKVWCMSFCTGDLSMGHKVIWGCRDAEESCRMRDVEPFIGLQDEETAPG